MGSVYVLERFGLLAEYHGSYQTDLQPGLCEEVGATQGDLFDRRFMNLERHNQFITI